MSAVRYAAVDQVVRGDRYIYHLQLQELRDAHAGLARSRPTERGAEGAIVADSKDEISGHGD